MTQTASNILNRYYDLDFFSGSQATVYIGDVLVDEITHIEWRRVQEKTPLYGYASQLFDDTARGHVLVTGAFSVNYKEQGYLWAVLKRWFNLGADETYFASKGVTDPLTAEKAKALNRNRVGENSEGLGGRPILGSNGTRVSRTTIERLANKRLTKQERYEFFRSIAGYATFSPGGGKDKTFEDIMEVFEDQLWVHADNQKLLEQIRRIDDNIFDGFDIYVLCGNFSNPRANHTAQKIVGVRLISEAKTIMADAEPIMETYQFIARTTI